MHFDVRVMNANRTVRGSDVLRSLGFNIVPTGIDLIELTTGETIRGPTRLKARIKTENVEFPFPIRWQLSPSARQGTISFLSLSQPYQKAGFPSEPAGAWKTGLPSVANVPRETLTLLPTSAKKFR